MLFSNEQIIELENILGELCTDNKTIPRSEIFSAFQKKTAINIEQYRFEREVSFLIKNKLIKGYQIKVGRNGGVSKEEILKDITIIVSNKVFATGKVTDKKIQTILNIIK